MKSNHHDPQLLSSANHSANSKPRSAQARNTPATRQLAPETGRDAPPGCRRPLTVRNEDATRSGGRTRTSHQHAGLGTRPGVSRSSLQRLGLD
jgi:hypothetical protein